MADTDTWLTPRQIITELGPFDTDPCCPEVMPWTTAANMITPEQDGLKSEWTGRVWLNPPYSNCEPWMERMAAHKGGGIALIPFRVENRWFQRWVLQCAHGFFLPEKKMTFRKSDGNRGSRSTFPVVFACYGAENHKRFAHARSEMLRGQYLKITRQSDHFH